MIKSVRRSLAQALSWAFLLFWGATPALAQTAILQAGTWQAGHALMYNGSGFGQPLAQDSGTAAGGAVGTGLSEIGMTVRGTGAAPFANGGVGPLGTNLCDYDAPTTNATGYHYLCLSPNAQGGGLLAYGAGGAASTLPFAFNINGSAFSIPAGGFGTVTSLTAGNTGIILSPSTITTTGTISLATPGSSNIGGVNSHTAVTHQFLTQIGTDGSIGAAQPAFTDISGTAAAAQLPVATSSAFGAVKPDNSSITISGGVITATTSGGTVTSIATTGPITGGTITSTGTIACATCATTTSGGALTATAPVVISAGGAISVTGAAGQVLAGASPAFTATPTLGASGTLGSLSFGNASSGTIKLQTVTGALGTPTLSLPADTDTLADLAGTQTFTNKTLASPAFTGTATGNGTHPLSLLAAQSANTVVGNGTAGSASPTALAMPSCSGALNGLIWTAATGFGCNTFGSSGGTVNSGTAGQVAYYASTGTAVSGTANLTFNNGTGIFEVGQSGVLTGAMAFEGGTSGSVTITPQAAAGGTLTQTLPNQSGTFAVAATSPITLNATTGAIGCSTCLTSNASITLSGDTTGTGTTAITTTTSKVNGVSYGTSPAGGLVPVVTGANATTYELVPFASLATIGSNSLLGNNTSGTASLTTVAVNSCSGTGKALTWVSGTGFGCNTIAGELLYAENPSTPTTPTVTSSNGVAIGSGAVAGSSGTGSFAIGPTATTAGASNETMAIGDSYATGTGAFAASNEDHGGTHGAQANHAIAIGRDALSSGASSIALGDTASVTTSQQAIAIGGSATVAASSTEAIAIGFSSSATGNTSIAFGEQSSTSGANGIAIGTSAATTAASAIALGQTSTAGSTQSAALGYNAVTATGTDATALTNSYASGTDSLAAANADDTGTYGAQGANSIALGKQALASGASGFAAGTNAKAAFYNQFAHAGGQFAAEGDAQESRYVLRNSSANASAIELFLDGSAARIGIASSQTVAYRVTVTAHNPSTLTDSVVIQSLLSGLAFNNAGTVTDTVPTFQANVGAAGLSTAACTFGVSTTNLTLTCTPPVAYSGTLRWVARVETVEVTN